MILPVPCAYCSRPVDPTYAWRRMRGWERKGRSASRRGGSDIALREHIDEFACDGCIRLLKMGVNPSQTSLI